MPGVSGWVKRRIVRRERSRRESLVGDDAAVLPRRAAERDRLERPADVLAFRDLDVESEDEGAGEEALLGLALDLMGDEPRQDSRALRMADQHDRTALVVVREIVSPRRAHILIRKLEIHGERLVSEHGLDAGDRHLAVDGRERPADRGEGRELLRDRPLLTGSAGHAAVASRIFGDGRIDIEAVDRGCGVRLQNPDCARAVALHNRCDHGGGAEVGRARAAEPGFGPCIGVIIRRARRPGDARERRRQSSRGDQPAPDGPGVARVA